MIHLHLVPPEARLIRQNSAGTYGVPGQGLTRKREQREQMRDNKMLRYLLAFLSYCSATDCSQWPICELTNRTEKIGQCAQPITRKQKGSALQAKCSCNFNIAQSCRSHGDNETALGETQTLCAGCSKAEPKNFAPPQSPFAGARDGRNLTSWRWSLPLPTDPVW